MLPLLCTVHFVSFIVVDSSAQTLSHVFVSLILIILIILIILTTFCVLQTIHMLTRCLAFTFKELEKSALAHMVVTTATATITTVFGLTRRYSFYGRRNDPFALLRHASIWVGRVVCGTMSEERDSRRNGP